jgi:hypothetical protein
MAVPIASGSSTAGLANVSADHELLVKTQTDEDKAGFMSASCEVDAGTVTGVRNTRSPEISPDYRVRVATDAPLMSEFFPGSAINTTIWSFPSTNSTLVVASGYATINGPSLANSFGQLRSYKSFPVLPGSGVTFRCRLQFSVAPQVNSIAEWGLFIASTNATPTDGAFFRVDAAQQLTCVVTGGGVEVASAVLDFDTLIGVATNRSFAIDIYEDGATFWIDDVLVATVVTGIGSVGACSLPMAFRMASLVGGAPALASAMRVSSCNVNSSDIDCGRSWETAMCGAGGVGAQGQTGATLGTTAALANNATPTAAAVNNTAAALTPNGLGGQFFITDTLATGTDGIVSSYQVPAGTAALPGKTLMIRGVQIDLGVAVVFVSTGHIAQWYLAFGHTAVSLATAEAATTKAPRRVPLGQVGVPSNAAVGAMLGVINVEFRCPIPVFPGEFVQTVLKRVGIVPTSGALAALIRFDAFWE